MLTEPIAITYNAVVKNLVRVNQDSFGAVYYLDDTANLMRFTLSVKHTIPAAGAFPESHLMRLDVDMLNVDGSLLRTVTSWGVMKTDTSQQDLVTSQRVQAAFLTAWTSANTNKLLGRES